MNLSKENKDYLYEEIQFVTEEMKKSESLDESLYYFSAIPSMIHKIFNFKFDKHLVFMHFIMEKCYSIIIKAVEIARSGKQPITIDEHFFTKLINLLLQLADVIKRDAPTYEVLEKICVWVYSITGNGYYLQKKGKDFSDI